MPSKRREDRPLEVIPAYGGWARIKWRGIEADVRFAVNDPKRRTLRAVELRIREPWVQEHRKLPSLSRIENAVQANANTWLELEQHLGDAMPDDFDQFFSMRAAIKKGMSPRFKLSRPATRRLDDDFYADVARAYNDAVAFGMNPRKTLALDSGIAADSIARWVGTAREKGYLPPGEPGKVTATAGTATARPRAAGRAVSAKGEKG